VQIKLKNEQDPDTTFVNPRELEVVKLVGKGWHNKKIAVELGISERTVQAHITNLDAKLKTHNRVSLVVLLVKAKLIKLDEI